MRTWIRSVVTLTVVAHVGLLAWSAWRHSPVLNEVGHIPAGLSHWRFGRFDAYRVNPPLVRLVASLPVLLSEPAIDWKNYSLDPLVRSERALGIDFVQANGYRTFWLFTLGRWACIPFSLVGAWVCYRWARQLYGEVSALVALVLWCACPNILGNGSLVMPDMPAAALGVAACYLYWRWLRSTEVRWATASALVLGLAALSKTTVLLFYPLWPLLWLADRMSGSRPLKRRLVWREACTLAMILFTSLYLINLGYLFEGTFQRLGDYRFQSRALRVGLAEDRGVLPANLFTGTWLADLPVPLPRNYVQGIDTQKLDFETGMRSYLRGEWSERGWWYFYLYGMLIKEPLGVWLLALLAAWVTAFPRGRAARWRDEMFVVVPLVGLFTLVSSQSGMSVHFRYVLPVLPFFFIWASKGACHGDSGGLPTGSEGVPPRVIRRRPAVLRLVAMGLVWAVASSLRCYPHSLSYFNELIGGPENGHHHMLDSGLDWGQDLLYVKDWYDRHPQARPFCLASYEALDSRMCGLGLDALPTEAGQEDDRGKVTGSPRPGWYAIDVYYLHDMTDGPAGRLFSEFRQRHPVDRVGYSTLIYHVED
ncbi:ArnT family glycosyltransferase [Singulisphaera rosea]